MAETAESAKLFSRCLKRLRQAEAVRHAVSYYYWGEVRGNPFLMFSTRMDLPGFRHSFIVIGFRPGFRHVVTVINWTVVRGS